MSAHTPGPWEIDGDQIITADAGIPICDLHMEDELEWGGPELIAEAEANARLIAAAPETAAERDRLREISADLLAALRLMVAAYATDGFVDRGLDRRAQKSAAAAITKATTP